MHFRPRQLTKSTVNPLLSPPSNKHPLFRRGKLISPSSKVLKKNKPPGGLNRGFTAYILEDAKCHFLANDSQQNAQNKAYSSLKTNCRRVPCEKNA